MLTLEELNEFAYIGKVIINNKEYEVHNDERFDYFLLDGSKIYNYHWDRYLVNIVRADMIYRNHEVIPTVAVECTQIGYY